MFSVAWVNSQRLRFDTNYRFGRIKIRRGLVGSSSIGISSGFKIVRTPGLFHDSGPGLFNSTGDFVFGQLRQNQISGFYLVRIGNRRAIGSSGDAVSASQHRQWIDGLEFCRRTLDGMFAIRQFRPDCRGHPVFQYIDFLAHSFHANQRLAECRSVGKLMDLLNGRSIP